VFSVESTPFSTRSALAMMSCNNRTAIGGGVFYWVHAEALLRSRLASEWSLQ
jgi:hypothetical protein